MCRVLAYAQSHQWLFVSQPTNNSLYPGFGIKKVVESVKNKKKKISYLIMLDKFN